VKDDDTELESAAGVRAKWEAPHANSPPPEATAVNGSLSRVLPCGGDGDVFFGSHLSPA
jgi:hypothetical protein